MQEEICQWESIVRDYELDGQGVVNHATYIHYLEQSRNDYVRSIGIDFKKYYDAGYYFVVAGIEIQYRLPLTSQEKFYVTTKISRYDEKRVYFEQEIKRKIDNKLVAKATISTACVEYRTGKSCFPDILKTKLATL